MMGRRGFISRGPGSYRYKPARPYHVAFADSYMREAQEKISARMLGMLCLTFKTLRAEIAAGLAQSLQEGQGRASTREAIKPHSAETKAKISAGVKWASLG
jgi:hypothetical protein